MFNVLEVLQLLDRSRNVKMGNVEGVDRHYINLRQNGIYDVLFIVRQINDVVTIVHDQGDRDRTEVKIYTLWNRDDTDRIRKLLSFGFSFQVVSVIMGMTEDEVKEKFFSRIEGGLK